ncbi:glycosyltransferase family 61 protein, partial [Methylophaga muralis]|uniref:glycosyltransferase family 61 protein n=1 Tax=Methylophaga muralis TaxID=291169 RepID=UPI00159F1C48
MVYLKRGQSAVKRHLANESDLLDLLSKDYDVSSYIAETTPINELYAAVFNADLIIGIEGSQLAHGIVAGK